MELSKSSILGLKNIGSSAYISDEAFEKLLECAFNAILNRHNATSIPLAKICPDKANIIQQGYVSLMSLIVESVKEDCDMSVNKILSEFNERRMNLLTKKLNENKGQIIKCLQNISSGLPRIIESNWRLDYIVQSNTLSHIGEPLYYICLCTEQKGKLEYVQFSCNLHELQDLSTKLKEIVRHMEKISNT